MSDFIVRFEGVELNKDRAHKLQSAIQQTVFTELSASSLTAYTPDPDGTETPSILTQIPLRWRGIRIFSLDALRNDPALLDTAPGQGAF